MSRKILDRNIESIIQNISEFTNTQEKRNCLTPIFQENNKEKEKEEKIMKIITKELVDETKITKEREVSILELTKLLKDIEKEIKRLHPYYGQKELLNDHRSNSVRNGDYVIQCKGELYNMETFRGVVVGTRTNSLWPTRIWVKMLLRNNKYVSFFVDDNGDIKKGAYIEVIGVCYLKKIKNKPISYYNIYAKVIR